MILPSIFLFVLYEGLTKFSLSLSLSQKKKKKKKKKKIVQEHFTSADTHT